ncbi:hypothetical protein ACR0ST_04275 [Aliidiomarina sp. Khilg15.8]
MADPVDNAQPEQELALKVAIANKRVVPPKPNGECHTCGEDEDMEQGASFCCRKCAQLWERKQRGIGHRI